MILTESELRKIIVENLLIESSLEKFGEIIDQELIDKDVFDNKVWDERKKQFRGPFRDSIYRMIVYNSIVARQNHEISEYEMTYPMIKQKLIDPFVGHGAGGANNIEDVNVPGEGIFSISDSINNETATFDDVMIYIEKKDSIKLQKSKKMQKLIDDGMSKEDISHFEHIFQNKKWVFGYPKTYKGSIVLSRMGGDLNYYGNATQESSPIGRMPWCIAPDSAGNMFLNYHRQMNLHMYIGTKVGDNYRPNDKNRKVCISFVKRNGQVHLFKGNATVNASNTSLSEEAVKSIIGENIFNALFKDAEKPERKELDPVKYYKSLNLVQIQNIEAAVDSNDQTDVERFIQEASNIVKHNENLDVLEYLYVKYSRFDGVAEYITRSFMEHIESNPVFSREFLLRVIQNGYEIVDRHKIFVDLDFANEEAIRIFGNKELLETMSSWSDPENSSTAHSISIMDINDLSQEAQQTIINSIVFWIETSIRNEGKRTVTGYTARSCFNNFLIQSQYFAESIYEIIMETTTDIHNNDPVSFMGALKKSYMHTLPYLLSYLKSLDEDIIYNRYLQIKQEVKDEYKDKGQKETLHHNTRIVSLVNDMAISADDFLDAVKNREKYKDDDFIASFMSEIANENKNNLLDKLSPEKQNEAREAFLGVYYSMKNSYKSLILANFSFYEYDDDSPVFSPLLVGELFYERYKSQRRSSFSKEEMGIYENGQLYTFYILIAAAKDKNSEFINTVLNSIDPKKIHNSTYVGNTDPTINYLIDSIANNFQKEEIEETYSILAKMFHENKNINLPDIAVAHCIELILNNNDNYNENLLYALSPQSDIIETDIWNSTIESIMSNRDNDKKELLISILSTSSFYRAKYNEESQEFEKKKKITDLLFNSLGIFYYEGKKAARTAAALFNEVERDDKLYLLYKDDDDTTTDGYIRMGAGTSLVTNLSNMLITIVSDIDNHHEDDDFINDYFSHVPEGYPVDAIGLEAITKVVLKTDPRIGEDEFMELVNKSHSKQDWKNRVDVCFQEAVKIIKNEITMQKLFNRRSAAIDMNKNKPLFEFYFNHFLDIENQNPVQEDEDDDWTIKKQLLDAFFNNF